MGKMTKVYLCLVFVLSIKFLYSSDNSAKQLSSILNANILANEIIFDKQNNTIIAKGDVDVSRGNQRLLADKLFYNKLKDTILVQGNIKLLDSKNIFFSDTFKLSGDMKQGVAYSITGVLSDGSLVAANKLEKKSDQLHQLDQVVYSPCKLCRKSSEQPTWQVKSRHIMWDKVKDKIVHTDARLEIKGVPIAYTPYLSHYGPNIQRSSGFLSPTLGISNDLGAIVGVPYYWAINTDKDLTVTPFYTRDALIGLLRYHQKFCSGFLDIESSFTNSYLTNEKKQKTPRGHLKAIALFNINQHWRGGVDFNRVLDKTYLKKYKFLGYNNDLFLTSRIFGEGFFGRNYTLLEGIYFQDLSKNSSVDDTPFIIPSVSVDMSTKPGWNNGVFFLSGNVLNLQRRKGHNLQRAITDVGWRSNLIHDRGVVSDIMLSLRGDLYYISNFDMGANDYSGTVSRYIPKLHVKFMYPLYKHLSSGRMVVAPVVGCTITKVNSNPVHMPNEDASFALFDDVNMFSSNHIIGKDLVDAYSRINYGLQIAYYSKYFGNSSIFVGQSYNLTGLSRQLLSLGVQDDRSDYVIKLNLKYKEWLKIVNNALLSKRSLYAKKNISSVRVGKPILKVKVKYIKFSREIASKELEQMEQKISTQVANNWSLHIKSINNLGSKGGALSQEGGVTYKDDCFTCRTTLSKSFFTHKDLRPNVTFMIRFSFKTLGEVEFSDRRDDDLDYYTNH